MATTTDTQKQATPRVQKHQNSLTLHSANVAMAPARSLTSHARRAYKEKYQGRYRFSRIVFAFDLFLIGVAATLAVFDALLLLSSTVPTDGGIALSFTAAPLRAADEMPVAIVLRAKDGETHQDVKLQWHVPDWVEIVRAEPAMARDGSVTFGEVDPGVDRTSLVVLRIRAVPGVTVPFDVTVHQTDRFGLHQTVIGREERMIASSAVTTQTPLPIVRAAPGSSFPILVSDAGPRGISGALFRVTEGEGTVAGGSSLYLGALAPSSTRVVFIDLPNGSATSAHLAWQIEDQAQIVAASSTAVRLSDVAQSAASRALVVMERPDGQRSRFADIVPGTDLSTLIQPSEAASTTRWIVVPFIANTDGTWSLAQARTRSLAPTIPFTAEARYYSVSGDQIGVGPISPLRGQTTRYWVVWSVDPGATGLRDVTISGVMPAEVTATGQFASTQSGTFAANGRSVIWTIPAIPPSAGQPPVTFAFEAAITPTIQTTAIPLIATSTIEALDASTGASLHATASGDDSRWLHDAAARSHLGN